MTFDPMPGMQVNLNDEIIEFMPLESRGPASKYVYAEEGSIAVVYKVLKNRKLYALKVFYPNFQNEQIIKNAEMLSKYKILKGLQLAERTVISRNSYPNVIDEIPE